MRWFAAAILCCALALSDASAESITVRSLEELVRPADVIARVTIVAERTDRTRTWWTTYQRVAFARVTDPLKGAVHGQTLLLYHDTVWLCPSVIYQRGDDLLLFAKRLRSGYEAIWWTTGTMRVRGGGVTHDLFPGIAAYQDVRAQVLQLLATSGLR